MTVTQTGNFGIASGSDSEVLQDLVDQDVSKTQILGFRYIDASTVAVLYAD